MTRLWNVADLYGHYCSAAFHYARRLFSLVKALRDNSSLCQPAIMHKRSAVAYPVSVASASESGKRARTDDSPTHIEKVNLPDSWKHLTKENNTTDCPKAKDANW